MTWDRDTKQPAALTREQLDKLSCSTPGCDHQGHPLILHGRCHPKAPQRIRFELDDRALEVTCEICQAFIALIALHWDEVAAGADRIGEEEIVSARVAGLSPGMRLRSRCHREVGLHAVYSNGQLLVACAECQMPVQSFFVLERHFGASA